MQCGICAWRPAQTAAAVEAGFDFVELNVQGVLQGEAPESDFDEQLEALRRLGAPCPVMNCLFPGNMKLVGPEADAERIDAWLRTVCERARRAGVGRIVFGSGAARRVPEGIALEDGLADLQAMWRRNAGLLERCGVRILVEHLNVEECNVLNTLSACAAFVRETEVPALGLVVDAYHLARVGESPQAIVAHADLVEHAHIATAANRKAPGGEPCDFGPFFEALREAGYDGAISIEGGAPESVEGLRATLETLRALTRA